MIEFSNYEPKNRDIIRLRKFERFYFNLNLFLSWGLQTFNSEEFSKEET